MATATTLSLPKPWPDFLKEVDARLSQKVELQCIGGFVLTALYGIPRATADLDYIAAVPKQAAEELERNCGKGVCALQEVPSVFSKRSHCRSSGGLRIQAPGTSTEL